MSSPVPPHRPDSPAPHDVFDSGADDADTGPLNIAAGPSRDPDWASVPTQSAALSSLPPQGSWAGRFDAPLTVSPRQVQTPRKSNTLLYAIATVVVVAVVGGVAFWLVRPSSNDAEPANADQSTSTAPTSRTQTGDDERLLNQLPNGYPAESCKPSAPPKDTLAQVNCEENTDAGGPLSATFTLARDKAALNAAFNGAVQTADRVNCPGNIQSPGPWRRNATPQKVAGTLFCGLREGQPTVIWTDDAELKVSAVGTGPGGPTFPELYAWWASHS